MEEVDPGGQNWPAGAEQLRHVALPADVVYSPTPHSEHGAVPVDGLCFPATHWVHVPPLDPLDPLLHIQSLRASLPDSDDDRAGQLRHVPDVVAPEVVEYFPLAQTAQEAEPGELLYVPAVQIVQDPPSGPLYPLLHVQSLRASLPDDDDDREGQLEQDAGPVEPLYLPAVQLAQDPPSGPDKPALQVQDVSDVLPAGELEFVGH